jgi:hypothetical protein
MAISDPKIVELRAKVKAAQQEFDMAVTFHELWKPAAYDENLHKRMGVSYATNAFHVMRIALRRETLLALMRLWDRSPDAIGMESIARTLRDKQVINTLVVARAARMRLAGVEDQIRQTLNPLTAQAIELVDKYARHGSHYAVREKLWNLRNERLAHRQAKNTEATEADATDEEIETFYQDMSELIRLLLHLVEAHAYDPKESAQVYRRYALLFWAAARGEKTEGHPDYRAPSRVTPPA